MSLELLTLINPRSPTLEPTARSTDGSALTGSDIAAALAQMPHFYAALLLQVYMHQHSDAEFILREAQIRMKRAHPELFHGKQWSKKLPKLLILVLNELEYPMQCRFCLGRGVTFDLNNVAKDCGECHNGRQRKTVHRLAKEVGVSRQAWHRNWETRHKAVMFEVGQWLAESETYFNRALYKT